MYAFDLMSDMWELSLHFNFVQKENLSVEIQFCSPPKEAVSLVCYGKFDNLILKEISPVTMWANKYLPQD